MNFDIDSVHNEKNDGSIVDELDVDVGDLIAAFEIEIFDLTVADLVVEDVGLLAVYLVVLDVVAGGLVNEAVSVETVGWGVDNVVIGTTGSESNGLGGVKLGRVEVGCW